MKSPEDNFENELQRRLSSLKVAPPVNARSVIFSSVNSTGATLFNIVSLTFTLFFVSVPQPLFYTQASHGPNNQADWVYRNKHSFFEPIKSETAILASGDVPREREKNVDKTLRKSKSRPRPKESAINNEKLVDERAEDSAGNDRVTKSLIEEIEGKGPHVSISSDLMRPPFSAMAQKREEPPARKLSRTSLYGSFMTYLTYNKVSPNKNDEHIIQNFSSGPTLSYDRLGWRASVGVYREISRKWSVYGGLAMNSFGVAFNYDLKNTREQSFTLQEGNLLVPVDNTTAEDFQEEYLGLGVIAGVNYFMKRVRKFEYLLDASLDYQRRLDRQENTILMSNQLFGNIGYRVSYRINPRVALKFQPNLGYTMLSQSLDSHIFNIQPFNVGVDFGVSYKLSTAIRK